MKLKCYGGKRLFYWCRASEKTNGTIFDNIIYIWLIWWSDNILY